MRVELIRTVQSADGLFVDRKNSISSEVFSPVTDDLDQDYYEGQLQNGAWFGVRSDSEFRVSVWLMNQRDLGIPGRKLRRIKRIELNKQDLGGCAQINNRWLLVVHGQDESAILSRIGNSAARRDRSDEALKWLLV